MKKFLPLSVFLVLVCFLSPAFSASQNRLAVINASENSALFEQSEIIANNFTGVLAKSQALTVLERENLDLIMNEHKIKASDPDYALRIGKITGCQYIVLTSFLYEPSTLIAVRIVDASTSEILFSDSELADPSDNSSILAATSRLANNVLDVLTGERTVITEINNKNIIINRGSSSGVRAGDMFRVYIDSKRNPVNLAVIQVKDTRSNFSRAEIVKNGGDIKILRRSDTVSAVSKKEANSIIKRKKFPKTRPGEKDPVVEAKNKIQTLSSKEKNSRDAFRISFDIIADKGKTARAKNDSKMLFEVGESFMKLGNDVYEYISSNDVDEKRYQLQAMRADISSNMEKELEEREEALKNFCQECFMQAASYFKPLAQKGNTEAQVRLGMLYVRTYIMPTYETYDAYSKEIQEAMKFLEQAGAKNNFEALYLLAHAYEWGGVGLSRNEEKAAELYQKIIDNAPTDSEVYRESCSALSGMYLQGRGVKQDDKKYRELISLYQASLLGGKDKLPANFTDDGDGDVIIMIGDGNYVEGGGQVIAIGEGNYIKSEGQVTTIGESNYVKLPNYVLASIQRQSVVIKNIASSIKNNAGQLKLGVVRFESSAKLLKETDSITDNFIKSLSASNAITVLNRQKLDKALNKKRDVKTVSDLGKREGCRYMLIGSVKRDKDVVINVRAVDVNTTKIIFSLSVASPSSNIASLMANSSKLGEQVRERLTGESPIISSVNGSEIQINRGTSSGVRKGDLYRVYEEHNEIIDKTGTSAGKSTTDLALIEIQSAQNNSSTAKLYKTTRDVNSLQGKKIEAVSKEEAKRLIAQKTFSGKKTEQNDEINYYLGMDFQRARISMFESELDDIIANAKAGNIYSQHELGNYYLGTKNFPLAMKWLEESAKNNNPAACRDLGCMYLYGLGTVQNYQKAIELFSQAAAIRSEPIANIYLGFMYENGYGVKKNKKKADSLYMEFVKHGMYDGTFNDVGILNNLAYRKALEHLEKAALSNWVDERGIKLEDYISLSELYFNIGELYCRIINAGELYYVKKNSEEHQFLNNATEWYKKALKQAHKEGIVDSDFEKAIQARLDYIANEIEVR